MKVCIKNIGEGTASIEINITKKQFKFLELLADKLEDAECPEGYCPSLYVDKVEE